MPAAVDKVGRAVIPEFTAVLNDELWRHHRELLTIAMTDNDSDEVLRIWNIYTGEFVDTLGDAKHVSPSANPAAVAFSTKAKDKSLGYLHNHPSKSGFSYADVQTFLYDNKISLVTVVTNQGEVYTFYKTEKFDYLSSVILFNSVVEKLGGAGEKTGEEFAREFAKISRKGGVIYGKH